MLSLNKYKNYFHLNYNNISYKNNYINSSYKATKSLSYLYQHKNKFIRSFLTFFSFFLQFFFFSPINFFKSSEFKINLNISLLSILSNYYNEFFLVY